MVHTGEDEGSVGVLQLAVWAVHDVVTVRQHGSHLDTETVEG